MNRTKKMKMGSKFHIKIFFQGCHHQGQRRCQPPHEFDNHVKVHKIYMEMILIKEQLPNIHANKRSKKVQSWSREGPKKVLIRSKKLARPPSKFYVVTPLLAFYK